MISGKGKLIMRYEIQSEAGDQINLATYETENEALRAIQNKYGIGCSMTNSSGSGDPSGDGDSICVTDDNDYQVAMIVTVA